VTSLGPSRIRTGVEWAGAAVQARTTATAAVFKRTTGASGDYALLNADARLDNVQRSDCS
jgi:hypothetical protein